MRKIIDKVKSLMKLMNQFDIGTHSSSIAFFFFLSIVPMLMIICTIMPYTPLTEQNLLDVLDDVIPEVVMPLLRNIVSEVYSKASGIMSLAIVMMIWSAAKGVLAMIKGLNNINQCVENRRNIVLRLNACVYTIVMLVAVILSLFLNVFGKQLVTLALHSFPKLEEPVQFLMNFRFIVVWGLLTFVFAAIYAYLPSQKGKFREQILGASFSSIVWSIFSWGFSMYITIYNSFGIYGSLALIIMVLIWLYFCMMIVLLGACINYAVNVKSDRIVDNAKEPLDNCVQSN